jgi:hypothetical protein
MVNFRIFFILFLRLGTIVLQKAVKKQEKARSLFFHKLMQIISLICLIIGFVVIYYNKTIKGSTHCKSVQNFLNFNYSVY